MVASLDGELDDTVVKKVPEIVVLDVAALSAKTHKMLHNRRKMNWSELKGKQYLCKVCKQEIINLHV